MRVTAKGQVTIPQAIREALGLLPDSEVEFAVDGEVATIRKAADRSRRGARLVERMRGTATVRMSTDEILALTRR